MLHCHLYTAQFLKPHTELTHQKPRVFGLQGANQRLQLCLAF